MNKFVEQKIIINFVKINNKNMKTIEELAVEYCSKQPAFVPREQQAFIAGAKALQEWISVEDDFPKKDEIILVKMKDEYNGRNIELAQYIKGRGIDKMMFDVFSRNWSFYTDAITHWRPIEYK